MAYTETEQRILDMWPKFEDGSYVQLGDSYIDTDGDENEVMAIEFNDRCTDLVGLEGFHTGFDTLGERVKRPEFEDSWERLKDDATMSPWSYCDKYGLVAGISNDEYFPATVAFATDLIRRAKALAEKEASR